MLRTLPLLALAGCVALTTRATVTVGAGGRADLIFGGREGERVRITNTGAVAVNVLVGSRATALESGKSIILSWPAEPRLVVVNPGGREAAVLVEMGAAVE